MRVTVFWLVGAVWIVLGLVWEVSGEIYLWTDDRGVVHMTDQLTNVPTSIRPRVSVRESSAVPSETLAASGEEGRPMISVEPPTFKQAPLQVPSDLVETPVHAGPVFTVPPYARDTSALIPDYRPFVHSPKKLSPPFPYNVRLDPIDPNFVWVGPNRVPKDTFTYPRVSLEKQAQFRDRLRILEQRRSIQHQNAPVRPIRP